MKGVSIVIQRSLRDLLHQLPSTEAVIKVWHCILSRAYVSSEGHLDVYLLFAGNFQVEELKAALSNQEYQIITECALSNISETPHNVPMLKNSSLVSSEDVIESVAPQVPSVEPETPERDIWVSIKVSVAINMVELCLHSGVARDASLASVQVHLHLLTCVDTWFIQPFFEECRCSSS